MLYGVRVTNCHNDVEHKTQKYLNRNPHGCTVEQKINAIPLLNITLLWTTYVHGRAQINNFSIPIFFSF